MSLLMDALRKAEEAKRTAAQTEAGQPASTPVIEESAALELEMPDNALAELGLEPLPTVEKSVAANPQDTASAARAARPAEPEGQRHAVQNAFSAKAAPKSPEDKVFILALACVAGFAAIGIAGYVWWQMQPHSSLGPMANVPSAANVGAVTPPPAPTAALAVQQAVDILALPLTDAVESSTSSRPSAPPPAADPVRITHSQSRVSPLLEQGYAALQQGNLPQAQQAYERMLAADPKSADAMYGLAAIAMQRQQPAQAEEYYLRILEADPRDPYAHAGLAGLHGRAGSSNAESRLKTLIADQPGVAPLHFALGNLYAQDQRWREAQQSYFLAYKNDSANPDIVFNLAVSLDQLHQDKQAAQYYGEALRLATGQTSAFNREQVQMRLRDLQASGRP